MSDPKEPSRKPAKREMQIKDIPEAVFDSIIHGLKHYLVTLAAVSEQGQRTNLKLMGSGTLVQIDNNRCILTAAHVWDAVSKAQKVLLILGRQLSVHVPIEEFYPRKLYGRTSPEWGPDLALLQIAEPRASSVAARKSFLNLRKQKAASDAGPIKVKGGVWAVTGMVEKWSSVERDEEERRVTGYANYQAFISGVERRPDREGYDYLDSSVDLRVEGLPGTFGGVSGGGLWQTDLSMDKLGAISWDGRPQLRGVAFWESEPSGSSMVIRCHGPKSVFHTAWSEWDLPD